jgi:hypothetical protein
MPITPDQQATLQLLLERGQDYSDLARLLGVDEDEVRARARAALTELGGADPDRNVGLTDYLLGQADPIGRADASRHLREHADDHALATTIAARLRDLFGDAELPRLPGEPRRGRAPRRTAAAERPRRSDSQSRLIFILGGGAVLVIAGVLAIAGAFGGDGSDGDSTSASATTTSTASGDGRAVPVQLHPEPGSDAGGVVVFGLATAEDPFIEFQVRKLEPATNETAYVLWFLSRGDAGFPLPTPLPVQPDGTLSDRISVPPEILAFIQQASTVAIALNDRKQLDHDINQAVRSGQGALDFPGGTVLSARITGRG